MINPAWFTHPSLRKDVTVRKLLIVFILTLPMPSFGQFLDEENRTSSDQLAYPKPVQLQVGIVIHATASPLKGVQGSTPIPIEWPEQQVKVIGEKIISSCPPNFLRNGGRYRQANGGPHPLCSTR